jgi:hypothetical protein
MALPAYLRQAIELAAEHPMGAVGIAVVTLLYINLMFSGPKVY